MSALLQIRSSGLEVQRRVLSIFCASGCSSGDAGACSLSFNSALYRICEELRSKVSSESLLRCGIKPDLVFLLTVPRETSIRRLLGRRHNSLTGEICNVDSMSSSDLSETCFVQRVDDNLEAVCRRVDLFTRGCAGALQPLRDALVPVVEIDGEGTVDEVFARILAYWPEHVPRSPL